MRELVGKSGVGKDRVGELGIILSSWGGFPV